MLRLIVNKSKHHYMVAVEHAERGRYQEAIIELQNALDLDRQNVNAHVVLGTVYARMGQVDKAIKQWKEALNLNPMMTKAHEYIQRAENVKSILPRFKIIPIAAIVLVLSIILNLGLIVYFSTPSSGEVLLSEAWGQYRNNNYHKATQTLNHIEQTVQNPEILASSHILRDSIKHYFQWQIKGVRTAEREERYYAALMYAREAIRKNPPPEIYSFLDDMTGDIKSFLMARVNSTINDYYKGDTLYARVKAEINKFMLTFPDDPRAEKLKKTLQNVTLNHVRDSLTSLLAEIDTRGRKDIISDARNLLSDFPNPPASDVIKEFIDSRLIAGIVEQLNAVREEITEGDFKTANSMLTGMANIVSRLTAEGFDKAEERAPALAQRRSLIFLEAVRESIDSDAYRAALNLLDNQADYELSMEQTQRLDALAVQAQHGLARNYYEQLQQQDSAFKTRDIPTDNAQSAWNKIEFILNQMPDTMTPDEQAKILFYGVTALHILERTQQARDMAQRLSEQFPDSTYTMWAQGVIDEIPPEDIVAPPPPETVPETTATTPSVIVVHVTPTPEPSPVEDTETTTPTRVSVTPTPSLEQPSETKQELEPISDLIPTSPSRRILY